ncbi:hypothetical protein LINGRAHAP2_LOCUS30102 [Linum grandiflorum]
MSLVSVFPSFISFLLEDKQSLSVGLFDVDICVVTILPS